MKNKPKTILILEDEGVVALDLQARLIEMGYVVPEIFDNGTDLLKKGPDYLPDLIIMDVMIKGDIDGIQTAQKFKEIVDIPIVFLTAYSDEMTFQRAKLSDAYAFLIKPFDQRELETTIEIAFFKHNNFSKVSNERKQFFNILKNLKDAIIATNADGYVIFYNDSARKLFQLDKIYLNTFAPIQELLPFLKNIPHNTHLITDLLSSKLSQYKLDNVKIEWYNKKLAFDLSIFPFHDEEFEVKGLVLAAHDVSEKLKFLEELQKSERQYRSLFERNLAGVVQKKLDGTIIHCNDAYAKIFGFSSAEKLIGKNAVQFYQSPLERNALIDLLQETGFLKNIELYQKKADGSPIWVLENIHLTTLLTNEKIIEATVIDITDKKIIENELKKSQINLLSLIEHTNIIIWSINKNYELVSFNKQYSELFYKVFGFYPIQGYNLQLLGSKHIKFWEKYYQAAFKGEKFSKEIFFSVKGSNYYYDTHFYPIPNLNNKIEAITIYANDITEKKLQQIEKQKTLDLLDAVFSQSGDGLAIFDYNGNIIKCNQRLLKILGFTSLNELIEHNKKENLLPKSLRRTIIKKILEKEDWQGEVFYEGQSKSAWLDLTFKHITAGHEKLVLARITDITEKIQAEEMRLLLETAIANTSDGVLILNDENPPIIVYANNAYFNISKRNKENFLHRPFWEVNQVLERIPPETLKKLKSYEITKVEFENLRADGSTYICEMEFSPIQFVNNKTYWLIIVRDITERKRQEQELMQTKLNQQNLIIKAIVDTQEFERQRFAQDLHDSLGQMLSALKINIGALESDCHNQENSELYRKSLNLLDAAIQELRSISHNLMPSSLEQLGINSALKELTKIMNGVNTIKVHYQAYGQEIPIDKSYEITLYRVVQELLNNSFKHSDAHNIYIQLFYYENTILLMYEDDGKGFDLQTIQQKSRGIGLRNIEHRIKLIQGNIHFESEPDKGFLCIIEVPIASYSNKV